MSPLLILTIAGCATQTPFSTLPTAAEAHALAVSSWGDCSTPETWCRDLTVSIEIRGPGQAYLVAIYEGLHDDARAAERRVAPLNQEGGWILAEPTMVSWRCWADQQRVPRWDFHTSPCS